MNKKFKVGDIVARNDGIFSGMRFEVTDVSEHWLTVKPTSPTAYTSGQWDIKKATLVTPKQLECKFVPGTTYKDRTGKEYRFVVYAEEAAPPFRAVFLTSTGSITCRHSDGILKLSGRTSDLDILPNKKTRAINVYKNCQPSPRSCLEPFIARPSDLPFNLAGWQKIGEVVEEYDEF